MVYSMASGTFHEPYVSDFDEIWYSCSLSYSEQIDICFTKIGQALFKISYFEIWIILEVFRNTGQQKNFFFRRRNMLKPFKDN